MPAVTVKCPHCRQSYSVDGSLVGRKARCKGCGQSFALGHSGESADLRPASGGDSFVGTSSASPATDSRLPETIGRFVVKERLGSGAFGAVYRAVDPTLDRDVAVKVPHAELLGDERAVARFLREARAAARLRHPNIVPVFDTGSDGRTSYIASAFIAGRPLADALDDGPFEPRRAARIVGMLADALHHAHDQGIVHRDVKPANILLDRDDRPHLTDFGLAHVATASARITKAGMILGTPAYLAPEQAAGRSDEASAASDQYSLGVTLYELLCGHTPFAGPVEVVIFHTLNTPPPTPHGERPEIPVELEAICLKALAKRPEERYPSCRELARDLGRWLAGRSTSREIPAIASTAVEPAAVASGDRNLAVTLTEGPQPHAEPPGRPNRPPRSPGRFMPRRGWVFAVAAALMLPLSCLIAVGVYKAVVPRGGRPVPPGDSVTRDGSPAELVASASREALEPGGPAATSAPHLVPVSFTARAARREPVSPAALLDPGWRVPYKVVVPVIDGAIGLEEYGPAFDVDFTGDENPGRLVLGSVAGPDDLRFRMHAAWTDADLYLAFRVWDDVIIADPGKAEVPNRNDSIELFIDGDGMPGDFDWSTGPPGNKEGFQLIADTLGNKLTYGQPLENADWQVFSRREPGGYLMEFRIPLRAIDTQDGPGETPAGAGSTLRINVAVTDNDKPSDGQDTYGLLWCDEDRTPRSRGEPSWVVKLRLARPARFVLASAPAGTAIEPETGVVRWSPPSGVFDEPVTVEAIDGDDPTVRARRVVRLSRTRPGEPVSVVPEADVASSRPDGLAIEIVEPGLVGAETTGTERIVSRDTRPPAAPAADASRPISSPGAATPAPIPTGTVPAPAQEPVTFTARVDTTGRARAQGDIQKRQPVPSKRPQAVKGARKGSARSGAPRIAVAGAETPAAPLSDSAGLEHWWVPRAVKDPVLDGRIDEEEYGPPVYVGVNGDSPFGHVYWGSVSSPADLSAWIRTAYTKSDLYIAVIVRDDSHVYDAARRGTNMNDGMILFLDGDRVPNDWIYAPDGDRLVQTNAEGFCLGAQAGGRTSSGEGPDAWEAVSEATADGYVMEYRIPLSAIDTMDGAGHRPAAPGSTIGFELIIHDRDRGNDAFVDLTGPPSSPWRAGEPAWDIQLHLMRPIRFELASAPTGAAIDPETGVFRWVPPLGPADERITVEAIDDDANRRIRRVVHLARARPGEPVIVAPVDDDSAPQSTRITISVPEPR